MTELATPTARRAAKKLLKRGHIRDNLEAFGVAILAAVLLKYFAIEAYQIPTSSMQPTLMGSSEAGVFDRILVDKSRYTVFEPKRWDVAVFHYPLQQNQNYVKRILGQPGDWLHIAGGNVYLVTEKEGQRSYQVLRKPDHIQERLWKELYPQRRRALNETTALGKSFSASPKQNWSEEGDSLVVELPKDRQAKAFLQDTDGGLINRVWDGYSVAVNRAMRAAMQDVLEIVPNAKFAATIVPDGRLDEFSFEIDVIRKGQPRYAFDFEITGGQGRLVVYTGDSAKRDVAAASPPFPCTIESSGTRIAFAHRDDELTVWRDGKEMARLDVSKQHCREGCELLNQGDTSARASAAILLKGEGKVRIDDLHIWRDLHYTARPFLRPDNLIKVPAGHYYMMGDNTLQSVDSRGWTAIKVGVMPDGTMVAPTAENIAKGARVVRGNKRPVKPDQPPDRDETPVVIEGRHTIVMIDEFGEIHRLKSDISQAYGSADDKRNPMLMFRTIGAMDGRDEWQPPEEPVPFVPRQDIVGRALAVFWPFWPMEHRLGFIR